MLDFINVSGIVRGHIEVLGGFKTDRFSVTNFMLFVLLPLIGGVAPAVTGHEIGGIESTTIVVFMAINGAALLALMTVLPVVFSGPGPYAFISGLRKTLVKEVQSSFAFCALVALATVAITLAALVDPLKYAIVTLAYFVATSYVLSVLHEVVRKAEPGERRSSRMVKLGVCLVVAATGAALLFIDIDGLIRSVTVGLTYFLTSVFMVNMLMVVRRLHILVGKEV